MRGNAVEKEQQRWWEQQQLMEQRLSIRNTVIAMEGERVNDGYDAYYSSGHSATFAPTNDTHTIKATRQNHSSAFVSKYISDEIRPDDG